MKTQFPFFTPEKIILQSVRNNKVVLLTAESNTYVTKIGIANTSNLNNDGTPNKKAAQVIKINLKLARVLNVDTPIEIFKIIDKPIAANTSIDLIKVLDEDSIFLANGDSLIIYTDGNSSKCDIDCDLLISNEDLS